MSGPESPQSPEPASPQPTEPAVKSRSEQVHETIDRNLAEREAKQKITDGVIAKRKQTAALEAAAAVTKGQGDLAAAEAEADQVVQGTKVVDDVLDIGVKTAVSLMDLVKSDLNSRETREIEMHNATLDTMNAQTETANKICEALIDISKTMTETLRALNLYMLNKS